MLNTVVLLLGVVTAGQCLYTSRDDVVELTPSNFNREVIDSDSIWIVEFYAPWCGHCKNLVPEYKKAATALKGVVKVGAVDADQHQSLAGQFGVRGFPTIKVFGANKKKPEDYNGARSAQGLTEAGLRAAKDMVNARIGGKSSGGGSGGGGGGGGGSDKDVIELTDSNFDKMVIESDDIWLVEFFAPWCGHCKNLAPHWAEAATRLKGKVKLGALDATAHQSKASEYGVRGYPTIKFFGAGSKSRGSADEYDGGRTADDIVRWAEEKAVASLPPPEIKQITSDKVLKEACEEHGLCVIAFLPHILDCQSECRNGHLSDLGRLGDRFKQKQWGWLWSEAVAQPELETAVDIGGFGYPAMVVVNKKKGSFATLRGPFNFDGINEFLRELSYGRGSTSAIRGATLPAAADVPAWDGKDGELPEEEDIDLSDVELDDLPEKKDEL
ncbi:protein disulfide-isomerase A6 homolog [Amphibalanus amphitrite]|uniref:protein disulfide-isomerase A6 homolog n=1 Tax=Amphibalanus amphitrite TaxID=1232801 RepID=UPI001C9200AD|nr:protein disulfide-isomerase A6 homolog [Amphibalanus amphitrite]